MSEELESNLIWKKLGDDTLTAEARGYCCFVLYEIGPIDGGFDVRWTYAAPGDPIRHDTVFETVDAAKAAAEAAFARFELTKFWDVIATADCVIEEKRKRHHEPGCQHASEPAAAS
jgi:hypothetical protein